MSILYYVIAIVALIIGVLIGVKFKKEIIETENEAVKILNENAKKEYLETLGRVNKVKRDLEKTIKEYDDKKDSLLQKHSELIYELAVEFKNIEAGYALQAAEISHDLDSIKDARFSRISSAATQYREKLYNEVQADISNAMSEGKKRIEELLQKQKTVEEEIKSLTSSRDAFIEANKREEELRLQKNFYKINLKDQSLNDISLLKSIEKYLLNKDPLYKLIWTEFYATPAKEMLNRIIGKEKSSGIYKITNQLNGKAYIGQSVDLHTRLTNHIKAAIGIGTIAHQLVHDAMAAEGIENFTFEIIEKCEKEQLNKKEKLWIETYATDKYGYNRTAGGAKEE